MTNEPRCLICESADTGRELDVRDYITGRTFGLQICRACGFRFTWPVPASLDEYYPQSYRRYGTLVRALFGAVHRRRVRGWTRARSAAGRVLEIGCGHGWMLAAARDEGWQGVGLERTDESARHARELLGLDVRVGGLDTLGDDAQFDLIIMNQVLEHLADPMQRLRACARLLKPGGWLLIGVPNLASWQFRFARQHWVHLDMPRHLGHFTAAALNGALQRAGLEQEQIRFANLEYDPFGWPQAVLNQLGFEQNLVLSWLTGQKRNKLPTPSGLVAALLTVLLAAPSFALSILSWFAGAGAIMEVRAVKREL
jgi:SAM-dependent methyltransferase